MPARFSLQSALTGAALLLASVAWAQNPPAPPPGLDRWALQINSSLMTTLNTYSDNWEGGEAGSFNWVAQFDGKADRVISPKVASNNTLKLAFGETKIQDELDKEWGAPKKSTDVIDLESILRFTLGGFVDPFTGVRAVSNFWDITDTALDRYLNPVTVTESFGVARNFFKKPALDWSARLGGAVKENLDRERLLADGTRTDKSSVDAGAEFTSELKAVNAAGWAVLVSRLNLYQALVNSNDTETDMNYWRHTDAEWESVLSLNVLKYVMTNFRLHLKYDREKDSQVSLKTSSAVGLSFSYKQ